MLSIRRGERFLSVAEAQNDLCGALADLKTCCDRYYKHDGKPIVEAEFYTLKHTVHEVVMRAVKDDISYTMDN